MMKEQAGLGTTEEAVADSCWNLLAGAQSATRQSGCCSCLGEAGSSPTLSLQRRQLFHSQQSDAA